MAITNLVSKVATFLVVSFFFLGVWDAMQMSETEIPVYQTAWDSASSGNIDYVIKLAQMSWGWSQITPAVNVDTFPWYLSWYGWYGKLYLPSGYLPLPGWEDFILVGLVFLAMMPFAFYLKKNQAKKDGTILGIPLWFILLIPIVLLLVYPIWCWVHLHLFFIPGAMSVFGVSQETAYQIWISFGERSESFSWFFVFMTFLGLYKGGQWGKKFKKW